MLTAIKNLRSMALSFSICTPLANIYCKYSCFKVQVSSFILEQVLFEIYLIRKRTINYLNLPGAVVAERSKASIHHGKGPRFESRRFHFFYLDLFLGQI